MDNRLVTTPDFEQEIRQAMAVSEADTEFLTNLRKNVLQRTPTHQPYSRFRFFGRRPVLVTATAALILVIIGVMLAGPQNVWAAVQRLIGFIPGIGFVDTTQPVLMLAGPVEARQGGVIVRVESAVSDAAKTRINLRVEGIDALTKTSSPSTEQHPTLQLSNGSELTLKSRQTEYTSMYADIQLDFEPLPAGTRVAVLSFASIPGFTSGSSAIGWTITLSFMPGTSAISKASSVNLESAPENGVVLKLLNFAQMPDKTAIQFQIQTEDPHTFVGLFGTDMIALVNEEGRTLPWEGEMLTNTNSEDTYTLTTRPVKTGQKLILKLTGPLMVTRNLDVTETAPTFAIDLGEDPKYGQEWGLDETVRIGEKTIRLTGVQLVEGEPDGLARIPLSQEGSDWTTQLVFQADQTGDVQGARISVVGIPEGEATGNGLMMVKFKTIPHGRVQFKVTGVEYLVSGSWEIEWMMP